MISNPPGIRHAACCRRPASWLLNTLNIIPTTSHRFGEAGAAVLRDIVDELLAPQVSDVEAFLRQVSSNLILSPAAECLQTLTWCRQVSTVSRAGGLSLLDHLGTLRERLADHALQDWIATGVDIARRHEPAGAAYFALESAKALDNLEALQKRVEFATVEPVLRLYTHAILGRRMDLKTSDTLPPDILRDGAGQPTSDGAAIYVPLRMDDFEETDENFGAYKVDHPAPGGVLRKRHLRL